MKKRAKLKARKGSVGLCTQKSGTPPTSQDITADTGTVGMFIR